MEWRKVHSSLIFYPPQLPLIVSALCPTTKRRSPTARVYKLWQLIAGVYAPYRTVRMQRLVKKSPFYHVDRLRSSIPYLVPRAAALVQDIGQAFFDSLYVKGVPMNQLIVTSVLRTKDDVVRLQRHNGNATDNSCHLYGTTFDICYNRYHPVGREVRNDTLKWVLSEVLRDLRQQDRCYIKYEVKQGCFHMTVR